LGAIGPPPADKEPSNSIFGKSLLEKAGLARPNIKMPDHEKKRFDVMDDAAGQIKDPNKPV
jgi:hypothetical protein